MSLPETATFAEFAVLGGWKKSWVTQLRKDGRLVLTADRKGVRVAESFARIKDTEDPSRAGVAALHAARRASNAPVPAETPGESGERGGSAGEEDAYRGPHASRRAKALADKEEALARKALRDELLELGQLLRTEHVRETLSDAVVLLRVDLESLRDTLAPELAALSDEAVVRQRLGDAIEHALEGLARKFNAIGRVAA